MILKNISKGTIISRDLKEANSLVDLLFGLLRKSNPRSLLFKTRLGIHTFGLKEPIDVIILDKNARVVKLCENLKPNCFFFWNFKYNLVVELPKETIRKSKTKVLDKLSKVVI